MVPDEWVTNNGIALLPNEIFMRIPAPLEEYYGSNYGRVISTKRGKTALLSGGTLPSGHINYTLIWRTIEFGGEII